jgi:hypothetical protein
VVGSQTGAAIKLGVARQTLESKIRKAGHKPARLQGLLVVAAANIRTVRQREISKGHACAVKVGTEKRGSRGWPLAIHPGSMQ